MNTELDELLNSSKFSGKQLGRIFILDDIDALNHNSERHQKFTPSVTAEDLKKLIEGLQKTPEGIRVLHVYKKLSIALYSIYNYSQTVIQQAQNGFFRLLGQSQSILNSTETSRLLSKFPMAITKKELDATRKKSVENARSKQISLAQALLGEIHFFYGKREKSPNAQEVKEALETLVTDSYLCGLRCNQDIITEGCVHFGIKSAGEKTKEALSAEVVKTFLKERHFGQSIEKLSEFIYQQASALFSEAFKNPQAFISRFPEGSISPSDMRDVIRALWYSIACSFFDEGYTTKEIIQSNLETLFEEYIRLVIPFARFNKPSVEKMVLEEIFQCAPLKYHYAPYKDGLRLCDIVEAPEERTGGTQEGFNALLRYADRLEPLLTGKAGETLFKTLKDPKTTAKACSTMSTVGELADKGSQYCIFLM